VEWAAHAGGIDTETAERSCAAVAGDDDAARKLLRQALQLREAIYGIGSAIARTAAPRPTDLRVLRDFAHKAIGSADLAPVAGGGYGFDFSAAPPEFALLGPVAWSALDLLATGNFERVKQCPSPDCGWLFLDSSKNNSRRWCDMASCGNRMKVRKHRERR
jgi:predicted RNA-binding Zn ribbon-like protein